MLKIALLLALAAGLGYLSQSSVDLSAWIAVPVLIAAVALAYWRPAKAKAQN